MTNIITGLQLYTVRNETAEDFLGTLQQVAQMGYRAVEFAGYGGIAAREMRKALDSFGLQAPSSHVGFEALENELPQQIEYSLEIGAKYIVVPWVNADEKLRGDGLKRFAEALHRIGEQCRKHGLALGYHNHDFEFAQEDGKYVLDRLFQSVPANALQAELDLFWVTKAGLDAKAYLSRYKGRCPLIQIGRASCRERESASG